MTRAGQATRAENHPDRSDRAAAATALALLAQLAMLRMVLRADESQAYFLDRPITLGCAARARLGAPCPACGLTRGVGLALHGRIEDALRLFPAAPLALFGILSFALVLLTFAAVERWGGAARRAELARAIRVTSVVYACALLVVWLGDWTLRLTGLRVAAI